MRDYRRRPPETLDQCQRPSDQATLAALAGLAGLHHVVQRFHGFVDWSLGVEAMDLVKVDVVGAQRPSEASICSMMAFRDRPHPPGASCIGKKTLVENDVLTAGVLADGPADDLPRGTVPVDVCRVPEGDAASTASGKMGSAAGSAFVEAPGDSPMCLPVDTADRGDRCRLHVPEQKHPVDDA